MAEAVDEAVDGAVDGAAAFLLKVTAFMEHDMVGDIDQTTILEIRNGILAGDNLLLDDATWRSTFAATGRRRSK